MEGRRATTVKNDLANATGATATGVRVTIGVCDRWRPDGCDYDCSELGESGLLWDGTVYLRGGGHDCRKEIGTRVGAGNEVLHKVSLHRSFKTILNEHNTEMRC